MLHARDVTADVPVTVFDLKRGSLQRVEPAPLVVEPKLLPETACPDLPAAVGFLIVLSYVGLLAAFLLVFLGSPDAVFNIGICAVYLAVYLGVPAIMLRIEGRARPQVRPDMADFLRDGILTWTGRVSGRGALFQILLIPAAVTVAVLGIGLAIRLAE